MSILKPRRSSAKSGQKQNPMNEGAANGVHKTVNGHAVAEIPGGGDLSERIKELVRIAQDQGNLTHGDIEELLADLRLPPDAMAEVYSKLRAMERHYIGKDCRYGRLESGGCIQPLVHLLKHGVPPTLT